MNGKFLFVLVGAFTASASFAQIVNGDFEGGNMGFMSDYNYSPGNGYPEMVYDVTDNPHNDHSAWANISAYSGDKMLVVNGGGNASQRFWYEDVMLAANSTYDISYWATSQYSGSPADIDLTVGVSSLGDFQLDGTTTWANWTQTFETGPAGTYEIAMTDLNTAASGNDFSVDDITLSKVPIVTTPAPAAALPAGLAALVSVYRRRRRA